MTKHLTINVTASLATLLACFAPAVVARADIFQWQYINPANPGLGKQPSATLAPDGAGANAVPAADLSNRNLTMAYLIGADLTGATATAANLTNAELSQANLTNANFSGYYDDYSAILTDLTGANLSQANLTNAEFAATVLTAANLTGAEVRGANLWYSGITAAQVYSTASYQAHDLTGIRLGGNSLVAVNLVSQNLTDANFGGATLTNANFSQANLTNLHFDGATLTGANLSQANLTNADFPSATLANANLSQANLTNASFLGASLIGANLTGAQVRGAYLPQITAAQLYSTASYQARDLTGLNFGYNDLTGWNFAGQNLTHTALAGTLTGANLTGAEVRGAYLSPITAAQLYSTASYQAHDLTGINLFQSMIGWNFADQNLTAAFLGILTGANLTGAEVRGANLGYSGITAAQLYTTASYQAHDLSGIRLQANSLAGVNLASQNLTGAIFAQYGYGAANLTGANLSQANLTNGYFAGYSYTVYDDNGELLGEQISPGANLTGANLSGTDARGANFQFATLSGANTSNLIQSNGHIAGLDLPAGASLVVRDYDGIPAASPPFDLLPIFVEGHLTMDTSGSLRLVFDADPWDSTISFASGIPVTRAGTLELAFAPDVNLASQLGRTIDLFDWAGVTPTGAFTISSPYSWNLSKLYTTGEVTLTALTAIPGDFNSNGVVDAADYVVWRKNYGTQTSYDAWRSHFGQTAGIGAGASTNAAVPEPATWVMLMFAAACRCLRRGRAV